MTSTPESPELNRLAALWSAQPKSTVFAALADALRKRGALERATVVATAGVASRPEYLPGRVVMARIYHDQGQPDAARAELRAALALDPTNPVVLEALGSADAGVTELALPGDDVDAAVLAEMPLQDEDMYFADDAVGDDPALPTSEPVLTESLAMLYRGQGHLEEAVLVLDALVARAPENSELVARRDAVRAELDVARPRPYDASRSGGRAVRDWLSALATSRTAAPPPSSFDAFYHTASSPPSEAGDLAAFQAWLRELDR